LRRLRAAGIGNLSVDLIAGLAGQTFASWDESLGVLVESGVPHASIYMLEVDEDSRLGREMLAGGVRYRAGLVPTDDAIATMYATGIERLGRLDWRQYEISNFCRAGISSLGIICGTGSGGLIWGWGWMLLRRCGRRARRVCAAGDDYR
jgi:oxygen-independent coproporphyrinogen-3 oxidase